MSRRSGLYIVVAACIAFTASCSGEQGASAAPVGRKVPGVPARQPVITQPSGPYNAVALASPGSIAGIVQVASGTRAENGPIPENIPAGCSLPDRAADAVGGALNGAVVWLTGIRNGKRFPAERRFDLTNENCLISPRVQPVFTGATINVGSNDAVLHHNRFINVATGEAEAVAPFNDKGEIIPYDRLLTRTAQYEIVCDVHPWTRGWLLVVDHPYFAQTSVNGSFAMSDVPAGLYHIRAWHPSFGVADGTVTVTAGVAASVTLVVGAPAASAGAQVSSTPPT